MYVCSLSGSHIYSHNNLMDIALDIVIFAVGLLVGVLIAKLRHGKLANEADVLRAQMQERDSNNRAILEQKEHAHKMMLEQMEKAYSDSLEHESEVHEEAMQQLQQQFNETAGRLKAELEAATREMLKNRQEEFEKSSRQGVSQILTPLNDSIERMRKAVEENSQSHVKTGTRLSENINELMRHSDAARASADRLTNVLRGGGKIQGDWGETVLTELLETQGLKEGVHFFTQTSVTDVSEKGGDENSARRLRPDVVLHLDRDRHIVIDAKVSLSAFFDYMEANSDEVRAAALRRHVISIENHVKELSRKDYSSYVSAGKAPIDYVIMFVPYSAALYAAVKEKPSLWRDAMEKKVYIADEQTLYAALKIVNITWAQISQAENHEKVFGIAADIVKRVAQFLESYNDIGDKLQVALASYEKAGKKLADSGQSIPVACKNLLKLGVTGLDKKRLSLLDKYSPYAADPADNPVSGTTDTSDTIDQARLPLTE